MKKILLIVVLACIWIGQSRAQLSVPNFITTDCLGNEIDLYSYLDAGNVVVLCWVMPCGSCVGPALTAYNIMQSKKEEGCQIEYFMLDDFGNTNCSILSNWGNSYNIVDVHTISDATVKMRDFGNDGMPKTMVIGGPDHKIYHDEINSLNANSFVHAVNDACAANTVGIEPGKKQSAYEILAYPNPVTEKTTLNFQIPATRNYKIELFDGLGKRVSLIASGISSTSENQMLELDCSQFSSGLYAIKLSGEEFSRLVRLVIN